MVAQSKLAVNQPGDAYEQEADRIADQIAGVSGRTGRAKGIGEPTLPPSHVPPLVSENLASTGHPLALETRLFMESKLGHDFGKVRVHTDSKAAESAAALGARAFTAGTDVVFGHGEYQPQTTGGMRLLVHELAHVVQQGTRIGTSVVQRDKKGKSVHSELEATLKAQADLRKFDFEAEFMKDIYAQAYSENKAKVDELLALARPTPFRLEYLAAIKTCLRFPYFGKKKEQAEFREGNVKTFEEYSEKGKAAPGAGEEESAAKAVPVGKRKRLRGRKGKAFWVDRRDARNIVVEAKVNLTGKKEHVQYVKNMEDLIEKHCARPGYRVNLTFVKAPGWDVLDVKVDLGEHPVSSVWSGFPGRDVPRIIAHELHHLLGLPDRYDYLSLASRQTLEVEARLHWIGVQIQKDTERGSRVDPLAPKSLMGSGLHPHSADICAVVKLPVDQCVEARKGLD